jgi:pyridoxamine 5'-phosphate oxidase
MRKRSPGEKESNALTEAHPNPIDRLQLLLNRAAMTHRTMPTAMSLATCTPDGSPSVRIVLLRGLDERGLVFYTNQNSRKGEELHHNPRAAVCLWWEDLQEQVRAEGSVEGVGGAEADAYFANRPRLSQLGAWASDQSQPLPDRSTLETRLAEVEQRFEGRAVDRPPFWTGYRLVPQRIEFWVERPYRLHDRTLYVRTSAGWEASLLYP